MVGQDLKKNVVGVASEIYDRAVNIAKLIILVVCIQCRSLTESTHIRHLPVYEADLPVGSSIFILTKCFFFKLGHRLRHWTNIKTTNIYPSMSLLYFDSVGKDGSAH